MIQQSLDVQMVLALASAYAAWTMRTSTMALTRTMTWGAAERRPHRRLHQLVVMADRNMDPRKEVGRFVIALFLPQHIPCWQHSQLLRAFCGAIPCASL